MREITAYDQSGNPLVDVVQWDVDVMACIKEPEVTGDTPVHFFNRRSDRALVVPGTFSGGTLKAKIPNVLLREPCNVCGYVYLTAADESRSILGFTLSMVERPEPSDIVYPGDDDYIDVTEVLEECRDLAKQAGDSKTAAEAARDKATAAQTAAETAKGKAEAAQGAAEKAQAAASTSQAEAAKSAAAAAADKAAADTAKAGAEAAQAAAKASQSAADASAKAAASAKDAAERAKTAAEAANSTALGAADESESWANKAKSWAIGEGDASRTGQETDNSKYYAQQAKSDAAAAKTDAGKAEAARDAAQAAETGAVAAKEEIENLTVSAESSDPGTEAKVEKQMEDGVNLHFTIPRGEPGAVTNLDGVFMFEVENGDLYLYYDDGAAQPNFKFDETDGNLYYEFEEVSA